MRKTVLISLLSLIVVFSGIIIINYKKEDDQIMPVALYRVGSSSSVVKEIEARLKWIGLFKGTPDNYYGYDTFESVKKLQKARGLKVDGIVGDKTLQSLGMEKYTEGYAKKQTPKKIAKGSKATTTSQGDEYLLAKAINGESRGEPYAGQVAVGAVVMNRVKNAQFPNSISEVVYQPGAFTAIKDGQINAKLEEPPKKAARDAMNGWDPTGGCIFYYNPKKTTNKWIKSRPVVKVIGRHYFAK